MDKLLRDAGGGSLDLLTYDANGELADVDGTNAPNVAVTDSAGSSVAGFTPSRVTTGTYRATAPGNLETLDTFDIVWSWANGQTRRTQFELVGRHLFTVAALRAFDAPLANETKYPDAVVRTVRDEVTERFEEVAEVSFIARGARDVISGDGSATLLLEHPEARSVVSVTVDGIALEAGSLANLRLDPSGVLVWDGGSFTAGIRNVSVLYEHGFATPPLPVVRAAMKYARYLLLNSVLDQNERATAVFTEASGYRLTIAGRDGPTGLPEVDAVLQQFGRKVPGLA
jgi:hypothetical protein